MKCKDCDWLRNNGRKFINEFQCWATPVVIARNPEEEACTHWKKRNKEHKK